VKVEIKRNFIVLSHTVSNPWTVVVVRSHTMVALTTVFASQWLFNVANCAILIFNEQDDVIRFFI
jgi:hypothetical protein